MFVSQIRLLCFSHFVFLSQEGKNSRLRRIKMAAPFTLRKIGVPPNSANLTEARRRVFDFFRAACRSIPTIMDIYNLQDVVAPSQLRYAISAQIRNNAHITDPKVLPLNFTLIINTDSGPLRLRNWKHFPFFLYSP